MGALAANLKLLMDLRSDSKTLGESVSSALETIQAATTGPSTDKGSKLFSEQNVLNRPQALPYLSLVDGARAVAAKDEAIRRSHSKFSFVDWLGPEIFMESAIISLKNSWCGLTFLVPEVCVEVAGLDLGKLVEVEE